MARSEVTNPAVLVGELDAILSPTYARRTEPFYSTITRNSHLTYLPKNTTTDTCETRWWIRVGPSSFWKAFPHRCACHPNSRPNSCTTAIRRREGQDLYNRRRVNVKVEGQGRTTHFVNPPNNSKAPGDEGPIDDRNHPYSGLRATRRQRF